jgi:alkylation response protein AidB-like acyl-CoA dehydrogenase
MNLDFSEDQKLLRKTARDFLSERAPLALCREVLEDESQGFARKLWSDLGEMGWLGTAVPEELGGAGFGPVELALLCEEIGRSLAPVPFPSSVTLATEALLLAGSAEQRERYLPGLASGDEIGTLAVAEHSGPVQPDSLATTLRAGRVVGSKCAVPDGLAARHCIVLAAADGAPTLALVDLDGPGVSREPVASLDPSRPLARLHFHDAPAEPLGEDGAGWEIYEMLRERAAILQAFEQIGGAERALELTREFTLERYAFGRPVASYQTLKHRMADVYVAIELARSHAYYGAWALSADSPERSEAACSARIAACDAFERATVEMIQMHGGVGYTWEYDCQLFYRRAKGLAAGLGSPREWRQRLVDALVRSTSIEQSVQQ